MMTHWRLRLILPLLGLLILGLTPTPEAAPEATPEAGEAPAEILEAPEVSTSGAVLPLPAGAHVAVIKIEGEIYDFVLDSLERRVDRALAEGATIIVLELDTYGGYVTTALEISKYIKSLNVPVVAWVHDKAYSAGTMIAAACGQIVMSSAATLGDSAPVTGGGDMAATERAKALSPILEEYRDDGQRNGYDYAILHAMCELEVEVYKIEHKQTKQIRFVNQSDYAVMVRGADPEAVSSGQAGSVLGKWLGTTSVSTAPALDVATEADRGQWKRVKKIHDGRTLLTMSQARATETGLCKAVVNNEAELRQYLGAKTVQRIDQTWSENLAGFLTHNTVRGILIVILLIGGYAEMQAPGIGLPGAAAAAALVLLLGAPLVIGLAEVWHILLFMIGIALLIVEVLFTPTFGILGLVGIAMMLVSLVISVVPMGGEFFHSTGGMSTLVWDRLFDSSMTVLISLILSGIGFYLLTKHFGSIPLLNRLVLEDISPAQTHVHVSGDDVIGGGKIRIGDTGRTMTILHPAGTVLMDSQPIDVVAAGGWVDQNAEVRVVEVHGNRIVVDGV